MESNMVATAFNIPPFISIDSDSGGNLTFSGFNIDIFRWLSAFLKIQITFTVVDPNQVKLHGLTKAGINQLINNESDILFLTLVPTLEGIKLMDYTQPVTNGDFRFMLPYPEKEKARVTAIIDIITPQVWTATVALYFMAIAFISVYQYLYLPSKTKSNISIFDFVGQRIFYSVKIISGRSGYGSYFLIPYNTPFPVRLVVAVLVLMVSIFIPLYTTFLTSHLTVPKFTPIVNSFHELASSRNYKLVEPMDTDLAEFFLNAETEPFKSLGESLKNQKSSLTLTNYSVGLYDVLLDLNGAYAQDTKDIQFRIGTDMKKHGGRCRFTASRILEIHTPYPMALRKGDPNVNLVNYGLIRLRESGLMDHWISSYMINIDKCLIKEKHSFRDEIHSFTAMNIAHQVGAFLLFAIGVSFSLISYLCELVVFNMLVRKEATKGHLSVDALPPNLNLAARN